LNPSSNNKAQARCGLIAKASYLNNG
jgi:hypothetical protein